MADMKEKEINEEKMEKVSGGNLNMVIGENLKMGSGLPMMKCPNCGQMITGHYVGGCLRFNCRCGFSLDT